MQVASVPLGSSGDSIALSVSGGKAIITITVSVQAEADALLKVLEAKLPAVLQPIAVMLQGAVDAELSQA